MLQENVDKRQEKKVGDSRENTFFYYFFNKIINFIGDFIPVEEPPVNNRKSRLVREDGDDDGSDDEQRVDMSAINGAKEREERREKFYSVQQECMLV